MRRVEREALSEAALKKLCDLTCEVAAEGYEALPHEANSARKKKAKDLWENRTRNLVFDEIQTKLANMAPGNGLCMYCEISMGNAIEHFWPKQKYHY